MAPHSSTLAWKIPWMEEPGRLDTTEQLHFHFSLSCIEEGNGNPLQCSYLENPRDREAWWAAVCGVAQSQTRLRRLSSSSSSLLSIWLYFIPLNFTALFYCSEHGLSWWMFHLQLKRICFLLLCGILYKWQLANF